MKLSEELAEMANDYTYISGSWLNSCASEARQLEETIKQLEKQVQDLIISEGKAIEMINKLRSCLNCTHCYNTEADVYCNKSKEYIVDFSPCCEWEISK